MGLAAQKKCHSIAFPALLADLTSNDTWKMAGIMLNEVKCYLESDKYADHLSPCTIALTVPPASNFYYRKMVIIFKNTCILYQATSVLVYVKGWGILIA